MTAAYPWPVATAPARRHPAATLALVLGIVSVVGCVVLVGPLCAPFAWLAGRRALHAIDAQPDRWSGRAQAETGRALGVAGTILLVLLLGVVACLVGYAQD